MYSIITTIILILMVLVGFTLKRFSNRPRALELRDLTQVKTEPDEAIRVFRDIPQHVSGNERFF